MPVEGIPDRDYHRHCLRCHRWHEPEEGTMIRPPASGSFGALRQYGEIVKFGQPVYRFMCHRCRRTRRRLEIFAFVILAILIGIPILLEQLGVL